MVDHIWIQGLFSFETAIARGRGVFRLMEDKDHRWKALYEYLLVLGSRCAFIESATNSTIYTGIEELKGYEEQKFEVSRPINRSIIWVFTILGLDSSTRCWSWSSLWTTELETAKGRRTGISQSRATSLNDDTYFFKLIWLISFQVLIVGAGQAGLMVAARLRQLKVDALIVE